MTSARTILTYGTFDLFHVGHLRLLERLAAMGDHGYAQVVDLSAADAVQVYANVDAVWMGGELATEGTDYVLGPKNPAYGWERNKGYGTKEHMAALREHGPTPLHRHSFAPVAQASLL